MIIFGIALIIAGLVMMYAFYDLVDLGMITAIIGVFLSSCGLLRQRWKRKEWAIRQPGSQR